MYNINDLQQNLQSLIKQLSQIQSTLSQPQIKKHDNQTSFLLKIPKAILLLSMCKYLTMTQINDLAKVCSGLRNRIFCPLGWKILCRLKTPYQIQIIVERSQLKQKIKKSALQNAMQPYMDDLDDGKYIAQQRSKYKNKLLSKYTSYLQSKQRYQACQYKVKMQKAHLFKLNQQINYLDDVRQSLDDQNKNNKQKLKLLSQGFTAKIEEMDELNDNLLKQRTKLQNQKQALATKIRQYQHEIQVIRQDSQKSKQILRRLKNYLLYKEL